MRTLIRLPQRARSSASGTGDPGRAAGVRFLFAGVVIASALFVFVTSEQLPDPVASQFDMGGKAAKQANARVPPQFNNTFLLAAGGLFVAWVIAAAVTLSLHFRRAA